MLLAGLLLTPVAAQAQTEIWSATLSVKTTGGFNYGCDNSRDTALCSDSSVLTDDDFTLGNTTYNIRSLTTGVTQLAINVDKTFSQEAQQLMLVVDGTGYAFEDVSSMRNMWRIWALNTPPWADGDSVSLSLIVLPTVSIAADADSVEEGARAAFTLSRTGSTTDALDVTVDVAQDGDFAFNAGDIGTGKTVTFSAGSSTASLRIKTDNDTTIEDDGSITVTVAAAPNVRIDATAASATVAIEDNEIEAAVGNLLSSSVTVREYSDGRLGCTNDSGGLDDPRCPARHFSYGNTRHDLLRLVLNTDGSLTFQLSPAITRAMREVLTLNVDGERFPLHKKPGLATFTWKDSGLSWTKGDKVSVKLEGPKYEEPPTLPPGTSTLSVEGDTNYEQNQNIGFSVTLDPASDSRVTVKYETVDGEATAGGLEEEGADYVAKSGTLTFEPGETRHTIWVSMIDDDVEDDRETFFLKLSNSKGATITKAWATGEIRNQDPSGLSVADTEASEEEDSALDFAVTLDPASEEAVTVEYATADGTATAGADYTAASGTLTFQAGETTKTVSVPIADDAEDDGGETLTLTLSNASGATITDAEATGTIRNTETQEPETDSLTAEFRNVPAEHDGQSVFSFRVEFSEDVGITLAVFRDTSLAVTGGEATKAKRVDGRRDLYEVTVQPDGDGDVTMELPATSDCSATGAVCTRGSENQRPLSNSPSATVVGPEDESTATNTLATGAPTISGTAQVDETLTASVSDIADADGLDNASWAYQWIRGSSDIQGANGSSYTLVSADVGERIKVRVSFTDDAGNAESRTSAATDVVEAPPEPLTATFDGVPAEHTGEEFTFGLTFSEDFPLSYKTLRDEALEASGGTVRTAKRQQSGSNRSWTIHVAPDGDGTVTVRLLAGSVETGDGRALSNSPSATVAGPVGISVADARVEEDAGAVLAFTVALSRAASGTLTVDYATSDGSAQASVDYTAASGTLTFQSGESSKTIEVAVLDDAHDEGEETLTLTLSNASSGRITDADATGTIENRDPLPRALLARFGRTAAVHVVEHVEERLQAPREPGFEGRFAGRQLRRGMERDMALSFLRRLGGAAGMHPAGMNAAAAGSHGAMAGASGGGMGGMSSLHAPGLGGGGLGMAAGAGPMGASTGLGMAAGSLGDPGLGTGAGSPDGAMGHGAMDPMAGAAGIGGGLFGGGLLSMGLGGGDLLTGSDFALNRESRGGILSFWSRGARSHFSGREGTLGLNGDVRTTMLGADYARGPLVAGLSLSHSRGLGEYAGVAAGQVLSSVTGLYPWLGYEVTDRVTVWGVGGYGAGGMLLTPDSGPALESGLSMAMAAAGTRGELVAGGASGFALAFKADALWVGTAVDGVDGPAGRLKATDAAVTRFRTGLEGSRAYTLGGRLSLTPSVELGLRHDGGDAETGAGMDVGVGLILSDAASGLSVDVRVRTLLVHQDENFSERGVALSLSYNPTPSTPLGFMAKVAPSWGGQATSGAEALWGRETMAGMAQGGVAQGNRFDGEVGYGLPVGSRFVGTPRIGFSTSEYGRDYRVGYGLGVLDGESLNFELGVDAQRRESPLLGGADNGVLARASLGW